MLILNMKPRNPNVDISNITSYLNNIPVEVESKAFLQELESEVKSNPRKARKATKLMSSTITMLTAILFTTLAPSSSYLEIDPELKQLFTIAMVVVAALAFIAAVIGGMLAGIWKMFPFFGGSQANQWSVDILKGFSQVLAAPIVIGIIVILFSLLFGKLPFFNPIEKAVNILLQ